MPPASKLRSGLSKGVELPKTESRSALFPVLEKVLVSSRVSNPQKVFKKKKKNHLLDVSCLTKTLKLNIKN